GQVPSGLRRERRRPEPLHHVRALLRAGREPRHPVRLQQRCSTANSHKERLGDHACRCGDAVQGALHVPDRQRRLVVALRRLRLRRGHLERARVLAPADPRPELDRKSDGFLTASPRPDGRANMAGRPRMFDPRNRALALTVARRTVSTLITLLGVAIIVFVILRLLPGNAITASLGVNAGLLSPAQHEALVHFYGLGKPPVQQFFSWLGASFSGNLGVSLSAQQPVSTLIGQAAPVTLELSIVSLVLGLLIGVGFGLIGALKPGKVGDEVGQGLAVVGLGVPVFVLGTALVTFLSSHFPSSPSSKPYGSLFSDPWLNIQQIFFPALVLSI